MISIIMRTHNSEKYLVKAIESIRDQTMSDWELIVIDDYSTDNTLKILEKYLWIHLIRTKDLGPMRMANLGFLNAMGDYLLIHDSDDYCEPTLLSELYKAIDDFSYCDYYELKKGKKTLFSLKENIFNGGAAGFLFRKQIFEDLGYWDEKYIFPEYDFLIRAMKKYNGRHVDKPLFTYRRHKNSLTSDKHTVRRGIGQIMSVHGYHPIRGY